MCFDRTGPGAHEQSDRGGRGVPDGDLVLVDDVVVGVRAEPAFVDQVNHPVRPRRHHPIGSTGHPAGVSRAEVHVAEIEVQAPLAGHVLLNHGLVTVKNTLRLAGAARRVVHDRVVVLARVGNLEIGCVGPGHQFVVVEVAHPPAAHLTGRPCPR